MVWPIILGVAIIAIVAYFLWKKDAGTRGQNMNQMCLNCKHRYPKHMTKCPKCGTDYFQ